MDITKYIWEAKNINEQKTIVGILSTHFGKSGWDKYYGNSEHIGIVEGISIVQVIPPGYEGRTNGSLTELIEAASRGFKDLWEIAPEGWRIVTMEEEENNQLPIDFWRFSNI